MASLGFASQSLISACDASPNGLALATRRDGRWDLVDQSEVSTLRRCGEGPVKGYVEDGEFYEVD